LPLIFAPSKPLNLLAPPDGAYILIFATLGRAAMVWVIFYRARNLERARWRVYKETYDTRTQAVAALLTIVGNHDFVIRQIPLGL
jgi:hypothetical protein